MPGEDIQSWSQTALTNGTADSSINWIEGMQRADVNNSARSMMAAHAKNRDLQNGSIVTAGTANAQTVTSPLPYTTVPTGLRILVKIGAALTNTGSTTLNLDSIGAVAIKTCFGTALVGGELVAGAYAELLYDGTNWILIRDPRSSWVLLSQQTVSGAATIPFTGIDASYNEYIFVITGVVPVNSGDIFSFRVNVGGVPRATSGDYRYSIATIATSAAVQAITVSEIDDQGRMTGGMANTGSQLAGEVRLFNPTGLTFPQVLSSLGYRADSGAFAVSQCGCAIAVGSALDGMSFFCNSGNISGTIAMYGVKK